jgi:hypothetical protein
MLVLAFEAVADVPMPIDSILPPNCNDESADPDWWMSVDSSWLLSLEQFTQ